MPTNPRPTTLGFAAALLFATLAQAEMPLPPPPTVDAKAYVLVEYGSGQVLAGSGVDDRHEPASLTKLMTAYVVFAALKEGRLKLNDPVTISERAWRSEGSRSFINVGTQVPADVLLKGMIVQSGNDASIALAEHVGGTEAAFVDIMNTYAKRLGMTNTHFEDASGMPSPNHYSTARDLATLSRALIRDYPEYYGLFSLREYTWNNIRQQNRNGLLDRDPTVDGIKTGHTETAGYCLISSARRQGSRYITVVLDTASFKAREDASEALLNYGFNFFETVPLRKKGETVLKARVYKGTDSYLAVGAPADVQVSVPRGKAGSVTTRVSLRRPLIAPVNASTPVGELLVSVGDQQVQRVPLYALKAMPQGSLWSRLYDTVTLWFE
jgi:serine-type D-Ala-D-Ala carboxypeptidase (penicillin-binding protein 5/6)